MKISSSRHEDNLMAQIIFLFVLPPVLFYFGFFTEPQRLAVLGTTLILLMALAINQKSSWNSLGITKKYLTKGFVPYLLFTTVGVLGIKFFAREFDFTPYPNWWASTRFLMLFIPLSIAQEFAYRSFLMPRLRTIFSDATTVVLVNAGLFTILHLFYPQPALVLPLAFAGGLGFATLYYIYPNVWLASFAHIILNFIAVSAGFFTLVS